MGVIGEVHREGTSDIQLEGYKAGWSPTWKSFKTEEGGLSKTEMEERKNVPYAYGVDSLMYTMVCTRPDIVCAIGVVSRHLADPRKEY